MKRILLVHRPDSSSAIQLAKDVASWLKPKKIKVLSHPQRRLGPWAPPLKPSDLKNIQLAVVLGGDGTYLEAVRILRGTRVPILGVNLGSLGFLTPVRADDVFQALELALSGKLEARPRTMLRLKVIRHGRAREDVAALNDVVIERGPMSQLINVSIAIDSEPISPVKADGLIVATPTGSTAYNLAAGGPILHPDVHAFVVTPICPHSLTNRPLIFSDEHPLVLRLNGRQHRAYITVDGRRVCEITSADEITIERDTRDHVILRKVTDNYFNLLREKLKFGERA